MAQQIKFRNCPNFSKWPKLVKIFKWPKFQNWPKGIKFHSSPKLLKWSKMVISFNNKRFKEFISDIYPKELTISETTESTSIASYLDLLFIQDKSNNITTKLYDKRDAFGFHIVNFPFMSSNIPSAPAYGVYASQLIRYAHCCSNYSDCLLRHRALVSCHRVTKLVVCPTHLRNSMADTRI